ncbi:MAG: lamin tail domain-containing protein, partial [Pseudomonadota bacterium]
MVAGASSTVFINEFNYDNSGSGDTFEFIEIANPGGVDLTGWTVVLYNGNGGAAYGTITLSGSAAFVVLSDDDGDFSSLQNGPDAIALVDAGGNVVQFLSYEGSFTATDGPANGLTSTDIGVSQSNATPEGESLQLSGTGSTAGDFTWQASGADTSGAANTGQTFTSGTPTPTPVPPAPATPNVVINEIQFDPASGDVGDANGDGTRDFSQDEFVEIVNRSSSFVDISGWTLSDDDGDDFTFP